MTIPNITMRDTNCSVTVMPIYNNKIGLLRRDNDDSFPNLLTAPGGTVEVQDGEPIDGVLYYSIESGAIREMWEKVGIKVNKAQLHYFCSLTLPNGRVVISLYCLLNLRQVAYNYGYLEYFTLEELKSRHDFAPGMKYESIALMEYLEDMK